MGLLEREVELEVLWAALAGSVDGAGSGIAISGEPGAGKSVLVEAACARVPGLRVLRGRCDPLTTPRPLGPVRDLLADLGPPDGWAPLAELCESTYAFLRAEPTVLVIEDLHWVDAASAEVLRFVVRRIEAMPCAILVTYRDDEIGDQHSARPLLGDFAVLEQLHSLALSPPSVDGVAAMLTHGHLEPHHVHAVTGGTLSGRHVEAASWWQQAGAVFGEAMAYADSPDYAARTRGVERLDLLGATAVTHRLRRALREEGVAQVPARPRASTRGNPAGLTNRQLEVARLVARGFTNAEIAERLFISSKTADHHVSAVLMNLGMPNRRAVIVQAAELGLS